MLILVWMGIMHALLLSTNAQITIKMQGMKVSASHLKPRLQLPRHAHLIQTTSTLPTLPTIPSPLKSRPRPTTITTAPSIRTHYRPTSQTIPKDPDTTEPELLESSSNGIPSWLILGAASIGFVILLVGADGQEALALGPEGPLVEEFWENLRRYGLYILTVSTGVIYSVLQPIFELLKNPITAILIIAVLVGSGYIVSQVLSAMVGITDFNYKYGY